MADVWEQHEQVSEAGVLLAEGEAGFADGPHQRVRHGVQETQQPVATLQLLAAVWGAEAHVWRRTETFQQVVNVDLSFIFQNKVCLRPCAYVHGYLFQTFKNFTCVWIEVASIQYQGSNCNAIFQHVPKRYSKIASCFICLLLFF